MLIKINTQIPLELRITDLFGQARTDITSVSVRIYHRVAGSIVEDLAPTSMSGSGSLWHYSFTGGIPTESKCTIEYTITDTLSVVYIQTDDLEVGYLESDIQFLIDTEGGTWEIQNNVMSFYKADGVTLVASFNLFDANGTPSMDAVFKRVRL